MVDSVGPEALSSLTGAPSCPQSLPFSSFTLLPRKSGMTRHRARPDHREAGQQEAYSAHSARKRTPGPSGYDPGATEAPFRIPTRRSYRVMNFPIPSQSASAMRWRYSSRRCFRSSSGLVIKALSTRMAGMAAVASTLKGPDFTPRFSTRMIPPREASTSSASSLDSRMSRVTARSASVMRRKDSRGRPFTRRNGEENGSHQDRGKPDAQLGSFWLDSTDPHSGFPWSAAAFL